MGTGKMAENRAPENNDGRSGRSRTPSGKDEKKRKTTERPIVQSKSATGIRSTKVDGPEAFGARNQSDEGAKPRLVHKNTDIPVTVSHPPGLPLPR